VSARKPVSPARFAQQSVAALLEKAPAGSRLRMWRRALTERLHGSLNQHGHTLFASLGRLCRTPFATAMTMTVIAIALALPATFHVMLKNVQQLSGALETSAQISLFLKPELGDDAGIRVAERVRGHAAVESVTVVTKEGALQEFKTYSGFSEVMSALGSNPLPVVVQIKPREDASGKESVAALLGELRALPEADFVQVDMQWVERLQTILAIARHGVSMISLLLGLAVLLVVGNTIRLELESRREEIIVAKLVGATNMFVRRPFLYSGFWYGFLGSIAAWLFVNLMLVFVYFPVRRLSALYARQFDLRFLGFTDALILIGCASLLGVAGAWLVLAPHLRRLRRPE
jgi:cell division transport system permease protein